MTSKCISKTSRTSVAYRDAPALPSNSPNLTPFLLLLHRFFPQSLSQILQPSFQKPLSSIISQVSNAKSFLAKFLSFVRLPGCCSHFVGLFPSSFLRYLLKSSFQASPSFYTSQFLFPSLFLIPLHGADPSVTATPLKIYDRHKIASLLCSLTRLHTHTKWAAP